MIMYVQICMDNKIEINISILKISYGFTHTELNQWSNYKLVGIWTPDLHNQKKIVWQW